MPPRDTIATWPQAPGAPFSNGKAVTPSDTVDLETIPQALYIGAAGDLTVTMGNGEKVTFKGVPATTIMGSLLIRPTRIWATGTTAASIVALW